MLIHPSNLQRLDTSLIAGRIAPDVVRPRALIDPKTLHPQATFLRILGVNYVHIGSANDGELYLTEHGVPFARHLDPHNWFETDWFNNHRQRLAGTGTVYRVSTRPLSEHHSKGIELVVKWSRVGQDVALDTFTLQRNVNAEFNTPFEEFARLEELRAGERGPKDIRILTQKPMAIFVPPEQMQLWQTGRSREKILARTARHPGIEIDLLREYIMLYGWIKGFSVVDALQSSVYDYEEQRKQIEELTVRVDRELAAKGFMVADHKPTHLIVRMDKAARIRRRNGKIVYAVVDYELLSRTADYEDWVQSAKRREYLLRQSERFRPRDASQLPNHLKPAQVLDVNYVLGRAESTDGLLWVVGNDPELFSYFLPERWRTNQQVKLAAKRQTYYAQTKDRIHLVWKVSPVGDIPPGDLGDAAYKQLLLQGYNSPFEEFSLALKMLNKGLKAAYPRAIYMTASAGKVSGYILDDRRFQKLEKVLSPGGAPVMPMHHDYVTIWGFWRGLEDQEAVQDTMLWAPIDVANAFLKGIIDRTTAHRVMQRHADQLEAGGFCDLNLKPDHVLLCYVPSGPLKKDTEGQIETRQCNFEMVKEI